jgi:sec-independent protein translocase protein TatB
MIDISFGKLILLALVALIVLGPEKLPGAARMAGALLRRVRTGWDSVRAEVERELQVEEVRRQASEAAAEAEAAQLQLNASLRKTQPIGGALVSQPPATGELSAPPPAPMVDDTNGETSPQGAKYGCV